MNRQIIHTLLFLIGFWGTPAIPETALAAEQCHSVILVGVNYFAGWWKPLPNKWHDRAGRDWRLDYPGRVPLLGEYNDQATMDREIAAAADYGVDFFSILWYYNDPNRERQTHSRLLNRGVTHFLGSKYAHRLKFMIDFCNHPPFEVTTDAQWAECIDTWVKATRHPSYLRVNNKLVLKIHSWHYLVMQNERDIERCRGQITALRAAVRQAGLGELSIGAGVGGQHAIPAGHPLVRCGLFDFTATYMGVPSIKQTPEDFPYPDLAQHAKEGRHIHANDALPWLPYLPAGWCPRPWRDPRPCFALPNHDEWKNALQGMAEDLKESGRLGFPSTGGSVQKAFTIYAWNEFGEGGFVAPTRGENVMKLKCIQEVFSYYEDR